MPFPIGYRIDKLGYPYGVVLYLQNNKGAYANEDYSL